MPNRRDEHLDLPYGRWAAWGVAASVALTLAAVLFAPLSPVRLALEAVDTLRAPQARATATAVRAGPEAARRLAEMERWIGPELTREIRHDLAPDVRTAVRLELRRELRRALEESLRDGIRGSLGDLLGVRVSSRAPAFGPLPSFTLTL